MRDFFNKYLKEFVYGSLDGTVTTFAIISASAGASLGSVVVLILGFSSVLADGFSMASSNYLSEKSEREQMGIESGQGQAPFQPAFATFISFVLIGSIPLLPYLINAVSGIWSENTFLVSCVFTSLAFIFIGQVRGKIAGKNEILSILETLLIGGGAAAVAYIAGALLDKVI